MTRFTALLAFTFSTAAFAQAPEPPKGGKPAEPAPAAPEARPEGIARNLEREQLKREVMDEVKRALDKQKSEVRDEVRAQVATQTANRSLEEDFQVREPRKKLELFEVDGFFRVRPELFYNLDLRRRLDATGAQIFPRPLRDPSGKTLADANMRFRIEPTLNISEDVRLHAQIDMLDNIIFGSTPEVGDQRVLFAVDSPLQLTPTFLRNALVNSVQVKRVYGEVNTPLGQFFFGRMGSQWGTGMLYNSGNCTDCDYGDTVDRFMFVAKVGDFFIVPMLDFLSEGPIDPRFSEGLVGQPIDRDQSDDARAYSIAIARRDTDAEIARKLQAGQKVLNYGLHFSYRHQSFEGIPDLGDSTITPPAFAARGADLYIPDLWFKLQTPKLRLEAEVAGVFGKISNSQTSPGEDAALAQALTVTQVGAVAQAEYKLLDALNVALELGFASGDSAPGMGNNPNNVPPGKTAADGTVPGQLDGPQFCLTALCPARDTRITNFRFNRDYRVDLILWRELFNGVTDAFYVKPGAKYDLTEGFSVWSNVIYSRALYGQSTPSSHFASGSSGAVTGDPNLGIEVDAGLRYDSGDGFSANVAYGVLFPLAGLNNNLVEVNGAAFAAQIAQTVRAWFVIKY